MLKKQVFCVKIGIFMACYSLLHGCYKGPVGLLQKEEAQNKILFLRAKKPDFSDALPYSMNLDGTEITPILPKQGLHYGTLDWFPNADQVVFTGCNATGNWDIYTFSLQSLAIRKVTPTSKESNPRLSPDGNRIVFSQKLPDRADIYAVNIDGSNLQKLSNAKQGEHYTDPSYTPDGKVLVYVLDPGTGISSIYKSNLGVNTAAMLPESITKNNQYQESNPQVRPKTSTDTEFRVLFARAETKDANKNDLYTIDLDGKNVFNLTNAEPMSAYYQQMAWSTDGRSFLFISNSQKPYTQIYRSKYDGTEARQLTNEPFYHAMPSFSPQKITLSTTDRQKNKLRVK